MTQSTKTPDAEIRERASWLINAGSDDTIRGLSQMTGTPDDIAVLNLAIGEELAKPKLAQRSSRLKPLESKLRKFTGPTESAILTVVPEPAVILAGAVTALKNHRDILIKQEQIFFAASLGSRLQIGLHCLKAHTVFNMADPGKRGQGRKSKEIKSQRDVIYEGGFEGWLLSEASWLKKPTAYKYMTAVRGLGLDHDATEKQVASALKLLVRKGPVSLASLCAAAVEAIAPPAEPPARIEQSEFDFLRDGLSAFRQQSEALLALKAELHKHPDMERVASARIYSLLVEITGSHWTPSDEPDALASVNPDAIEL